MARIQPAPAMGRRRTRSADTGKGGKTFLLATLVLLTLALLSQLPTLTPLKGSPASRLIRRDDVPWTDDEACHRVHHYALKDQCAFIKANCPDEEAGLFSYLTLYYCDMANVKPLALVIIIIWTALLFTTIGVAASDFFCINLSTISNKLGMSESMAGVTFLAFGNGSPDVFSTFAAVRTHSGSLAVGELIGAAGFITAVVSGSMALIRPFHVYKKSFVRDIGFFIVAVSFSMVFLANGSLALWECAVMVGFYVFYVLVVVVWHWYLTQRRRRREREFLARGHFVTGSSTEIEAEEQYHDEDDTTSDQNTRVVTDDDFDALERAGYLDEQEYEDLDDEETRDKWMGELTSNMRVTKPPDRDRAPAYTPIRPSLVGALEFRAVLSSLQKSRHQAHAAMSMRRYSDAPPYTTAQQGAASESNPEGAQNVFQSSIEELESQREGFSRGRALTAVEPGTRYDYRGQLRPERALLSISPSPPRGKKTPAAPAHDVKPSPAVSITSAPDYFEAPPVRANTGDRLAPPEYHRTHERPQRPTLAIPSPPVHSPKHSPIHSPLIAALSARSRSSSRAHSMLLPAASEQTDQGLVFPVSKKIAKWWPSAFPPPSQIARTVFPTLYNWHEKSVWEKLLGVLSAPSFFLLAVTLPVVELEKEPESPLEALESAKPLASPHPHARNTATAAVAIEQAHHHMETLEALEPPPPPLETAAATSSAHEWNRWLVLVHCVTAPWFIVLVVWANFSLARRELLLWSLYSLLGSLVALAIVLSTTSPSRPPPWHSLLCFVGFAVSITWISTIANEVVGVLKTIGVIFNMSDAILGLTIFAVGNSLGDFVADVTVARLGYPVMALSACFGGPMLNILLGIGLSGLYMTVDKAERRHHKHPGAPLKFKPYHIEVSTTLLISAVALLVTLVGLLIAVPLNGWKMDRKIGVGLIALWVVATIGNVVVEVVGAQS